MPTGQLNGVLRHLRRAGLLRESLGLTDAHLLESFLARRDEAAFAALVERHGPMVWGVCRRVLRDHCDAEDAFQATFLLLARKAASILRRELVGGWLYRVAYRTALEARAVRAKRQARERQVKQMPERETAPVEAWHDLRPLLDQELDRLPDKYRVPIILCDLEGRSRKEVARQLKLPEGTLSSRLATARQMLAGRLVRHGLSVSGGALAAALAQSATLAGVPNSLAASTAKAATVLAAGGAPATAVPVKVGALMEGVSKAMLLTKLKIVSALLLLSLAVTGAGFLAQQTPAEKPPEAKQAERFKPPAKDTDRPQTAEKKARTDHFGDPLPAGAVARMGTTRWWHGRVQQECPLRYAPDGKILACCDGKAVRFLDAATGKEVRRIEPEGDDVTSFALSPDRKTMVTASLRSPLLRLWEVATGKEVRQLPGAKSGTSCIAFSPDGKTLAAGCIDIQLWDASTWQETHRLTGHKGTVSSLVFLPDGKTLISGGGTDRTIRWWEVGTGKEIRHLDKGLEHSRLLAVSPDGKRLAGAAKPGVLHLWNAATGEELSRTALVQERNYGIWYLCFSPDSKTLACSNANGKATRFFAAENGQELRHWDEDRGVSWMAYSPDGKVLAQLANSIVRLRDAATGKPAPDVLVHPDYVLAVRFAPDGKTLIASCRGSHTGFWDPLTGKQRAPLQPPPEGFAGPSGMLLAPALTGDGKKAALVDAKGVLHVWDPATGKVLCRIGDPLVGEDQADFSPDGKVLVVKHQDHVIRLWDAATGKLLHPLSLPKGATGRWFPHPHAFSPDGRVLATAPASDEDGAIRLWATATGKELGRLPRRDGTYPTCLAFSADGKRLVTAHGGDGPEPDDLVRPVEADAISLRLWDTATGRELWRSKVLSSDIRAVAVSPDGKTVAAADYDTIRLWELASGKERGHFAGHREHVWSLAFSPDGRLLASGSHDHTVLVWDVTGVCPDGKWSAREIPPDEIERLWSDLAGADGPQAYRAVWTLAASGGQAVPFLKERVRPTMPADAKQVAQLIADLDSDRFAVRQRATAELEKLSERAESALRKALAKNPSAEARRRLEELLRRLEEPVTSVDTLRTLRAVEVLETTGTKEARAVLETLARGVAEARLTREAKASLERLAKRPAATP